MTVTIIKTLSIDEDLLWKDFIESCLKDFLYDGCEDYTNNEKVYNSLNRDEQEEIVNKLYEDLLKKHLTDD